jgi:hypothetical protein
MIIYSDWTKIGYKNQNFDCSQKEIPRIFFFFFSVWLWWYDVWTTRKLVGCALHFKTTLIRFYFSSYIHSPSLLYIAPFAEGGHRRISYQITGHQRALRWHNKKNSEYASARVATPRSIDDQTSMVHVCTVYLKTEKKGYTQHHSLSDYIALY